jgi:hypothetical protein
MGCLFNMRQETTYSAQRNFARIAVAGLNLVFRAKKNPAYL